MEIHKLLIEIETSTNGTQKVVEKCIYDDPSACNSTEGLSDIKRKRSHSAVQMKQNKKRKVDNKDKRPASPSNKKVRNTASISYAERLEEVYQQNKYPTKGDHQQIGKIVNRTEEQIRRWFANRRQKDIKNGVINPQRVLYSKEEKKILEEVYQQNKYPTKDDRQQIGQTVNRTGKQIRRWFIARRRKDKKNDAINFQRFTQEEKKQLEELYQQNKYPTKEYYQQIGKMVNRTGEQIHMWFRGRRQKDIKNGVIIPRYLKYTKEEKEQLEKLYQQNKYPTKEERERIGKMVNRTGKQIDRWFDRHRQKDIKNGVIIPRFVKYTKGEKKQLEEFYQQNKYPTEEECQQISQIVNKTKEQIYMWFMGRRRKDKKEQF